MSNRPRLRLPKPSVAPHQREALLALVRDEYLDIPAACAAVGVPISDIDPGLMEELYAAFSTATSLLRANMLRKVLAAGELDPAARRFIEQQISRREEQAQTASSPSTTVPYHHLLSDDHLEVLEGLLKGDEEPLLSLVAREVERALREAQAQRQERRKRRRLAQHQHSTKAQVGGASGRNLSDGGQGECLSPPDCGGNSCAHQIPQSQSSEQSQSQHHCPTENSEQSQSQSQGSQSDSESRENSPSRQKRQKNTFWSVQQPAIGPAVAVVEEFEDQPPPPPPRLRDRAWPPVGGALPDQPFFPDDT